MLWLVISLFISSLISLSKLLSLAKSNKLLNLSFSEIISLFIISFIKLSFLYSNFFLIGDLIDGIRVDNVLLFKITIFGAVFWFKWYILCFN